MPLFLTLPRAFDFSVPLGLSVSLLLPLLRLDRRGRHPRPLLLRGRPIPGKVSKMVANGGAPPRGSAAAAAGLRRRRGGGGGSTASSGVNTMLQFYADDVSGRKISPNVVLGMSIGFIFVVAILHVFGKLYLSKSN